jgi:hypothetical protein
MGTNSIFTRPFLCRKPRLIRAGRHAEIKADDLIEEALQQSGLYDEILESVQSGDREIFEHLLIAFEKLVIVFRIYKHKAWGFGWKPGTWTS